MSNIITLEIDGIKIPIRACLDFSQSYSVISAFTTVRTMDGTAIRMGTYTKLSTSLSGTGYLPPALDALNTGVPHVLKCVAPRQCEPSESNVITVPAERRSDVPLVGYALVDDDVVETPVTLVGNTATLDIVSGASSYQVVYVPELTVIISPVSGSTDIRSAQYSWTLSAEEV